LAFSLFYRGFVNSNLALTVAKLGFDGSETWLSPCFIGVWKKERERRERERTLPPPLGLPLSPIPPRGTKPSFGGVKAKFRGRESQINFYESACFQGESQITPPKALRGYISRATTPGASSPRVGQMSLVDRPLRVKRTALRFSGNMGAHLRGTLGDGVPGFA